MENAIWTKVEDKFPPDNVWVIGLCKLTHEVNKDQPPVIFQVKYRGPVGWSDWCGDREDDSDWKVLKWLSVPGDEKAEINEHIFNNIKKLLENSATAMLPEYQKVLVDDFWNLL